MRKEKKKLQFKRYRKTKEAALVLNNEFMKNPNWSRELMEKLALELNLIFYTIYKWNYD